MGTSTKKSALALTRLSTRGVTTNVMAPKLLISSKRSTSAAYPASERKKPNLCKKYSFKKCDGIVFDFGVSSFHFEEAGRGFTFKRDEPLDMRYSDSDKETSMTAADILRTYPEEKLASLFKTYGGDRYAKPIAKEISEYRKHRQIERTTELVDIVLKAIPHRERYAKIHPATRVFQALRIEVNRELDNITNVLRQIFGTVKKGGRAVFISFHSLEDGIVKRFLKEQEKHHKLAILTKKPIVPAKSEVILNPRARSAKLRAARII